GRVSLGRVDHGALAETPAAEDVRGATRLERVVRPKEHVPSFRTRGRWLRLASRKPTTMSSRSSTGEGCALYWQPGGLPLGEPFGEAPRRAAARAKELHRAIGVNAVRAAAIGDELLSLGEPSEALRELVDRDRDRA